MKKVTYGKTYAVTLSKNDISKISENLQQRFKRATAFDKCRSDYTM